MRLTPRAEEVAAIAAVLEGEYATAEDMAKDVLKRAAEVLGMRDTWAICSAYVDGDGFRHTINYGPYGSEGDATKALSQLAGNGTVRAVVKINSSGVLEGNWHGALWKGFCKCAHAPGEHRYEGNTKGPCAICSCKKYAEYGVAPKKKAAPRKKSTQNS